MGKMQTVHSHPGNLLNDQATIKQAAVDGFYINSVSIFLV